MGILGKLNKFIPEEILWNIFKVIFLPGLTYCIEVWGALSIMDGKKINVLYRKAIKKIRGKYEMETEEIIEELKLRKILTFKNQFKLTIA